MKSPSPSIKSSSLLASTEKLTTSPCVAVSTDDMQREASSRDGIYSFVLTLRRCILYYYNYRHI